MNLQIPQNRKVQIKIVNLKSTFFNRKTRKTKLILLKRIRVDFRTDSQHTYITTPFYSNLQVLQPTFKWLLLRPLRGVTYVPSLNFNKRSFLKKAAQPSGRREHWTCSLVVPAPRPALATHWICSKSSRVQILSYMYTCK